MILTWINDMLGPIGSLLTGAIGGQVLNHFIISKRELRKNNQNSISRFYYPLYEAIRNYFDSCTFYRPGDLSDEGKSQYKQQVKIITFIEEGISYASNSVLESHYKLKYSALYDDNSGLQENKLTHLLMYNVLKSYYKIVDKKQKDSMKSQILLFQLWMLCHDLNISDPDGALSLKIFFNLKKFASKYELEDFEDMMHESSNELRMVFLKKMLKEIVEESHLDEVIQRFFNPTHIWEDSEAISRISYIHDIINDTHYHDIILTIYDRKSLRELLLNDICIKYFYGERNEKYKYFYTEENFNNMHREKTLAIDYLLESGLLKKINQQDNKIVIIPSKKGMDEFEKEKLSL